MSLLLPFGDDVPEQAQKLNVLTVLSFVVAGTALAVAWIGRSGGPPSDLFAAMLGLNAAFVIAMAVDAQSGRDRFHRWMQSSMAIVVGGTVVVSLVGLGVPDGEIGDGISSLALIPSFAGTGIALGSLSMFLLRRMYDEAAIEDHATDASGRRVATSRPAAPVPASLRTNVARDEEIQSPE
jgi:hypothetical protein